MPNDMRITLKKKSGAEIECSVLMSFEKNGMLYILYSEESECPDMPADIRMIKIDIDDILYARPLTVQQTDATDWEYLAEMIEQASPDIIYGGANDIAAGEPGLPS